MSRPLLAHLTELEPVVARVPPGLLGLDYDGTLTAIVDDPARAKLGSEIRTVLRTLADRSPWTLAVISGRRLNDVRTLVGIEGVIYGGNHGLEILGPRLCRVDPVASERQEALSALAGELAVAIGGIEGAFVENKGLTISVHMRRAAPSLHATCRAIVEFAVRSRRDEFRWTPGDMVLEVRPVVDWDKGRAIEWIQHELSLRSAPLIFVGDDRTDEDVFRRFPGDITIKVGNPESTAARFHVNGPDELARFLRWLVPAPDASSEIRA